MLELQINLSKFVLVPVYDVPPLWELVDIRNGNGLDRTRELANSNLTQKYIVQPKPDQGVWTVWSGSNWDVSTFFISYFFKNLKSEQFRKDPNLTR